MTQDSEDIEETVIYIKNLTPGIPPVTIPPTQPSDPGTPSTPTTPSNPSTSSNPVPPLKPAIPLKPVIPLTSGNKVTTTSGQKVNAETTKTDLPQAGDSNKLTLWTVITGLVLIIGSLVLLNRKRKED